MRAGFVQGLCRVHAGSAQGTERERKGNGKGAGRRSEWSEYAVAVAFAPSHRGCG